MTRVLIFLNGAWTGLSVVEFTGRSMSVELFLLVSSRTDTEGCVFPCELVGGLVLHQARLRGLAAWWNWLTIKVLFNIKILWVLVLKVPFVVSALGLQSWNSGLGTVSGSTARLWGLITTPFWPLCTYWSADSTGRINNINAFIDQLLIAFTVGWYTVCGGSAR